jgi:FkbM family methyltransferase
VREPLHFTLAELRGSDSRRLYHLRGSGLTTLVRHPMLDMWVLEEVFRFRCYEPPAPVERLLERLRCPPRILDLGGHVGLFALYALGRFPGATVISFEPDPGNADVLAGCIEANGLGERWRLIRACATSFDGTVQFESDFHLSRVARSDRGLIEKHREIRTAFPFMADSALLEVEHRTVEARDVFPYLGEADLAKLDIEGAEWEILTDPRFSKIQARVLVLEYHPAYGPGEDASRIVREALAAAGYRAAPAASVHGAELLWAWKEPMDRPASGRSS